MANESQALYKFPNLAQASVGPDQSFGRNRRVAERLSRLKQARIENTRGRIAQIEATIADFDRMTRDLEGWIKAEQDRTRVHDPGHVAYSTLAKAFTERRDKLMRSTEELKTPTRRRPGHARIGETCGRDELPPVSLNHLVRGSSVSGTVRPSAS
jgi:hypothetical protein